MTSQPRWMVASFRRRLHCDRGEVGSALILMVVFVQVLLLVVHASLVYHGRQVASSAAQEALYAAQSLDASNGDGKQAGEEFLTLTNSLTGTNVAVDRGARTVRVTVSGKIATTVLPFASNVSVTVEGPVEEFRTESRRS